MEKNLAVFDQNKIPKIIHYVWVGGKEKNQKIKKCMETWKKILPDYQIKEWNEDNFDIDSNPYVKKAYEEKKWAFVSDYIRMFAIYNEGGIYFDTDVLVVKKLDELLDNDCFVGYENDESPFTAVFGAKRHHPLMKRILHMYDTVEQKFDENATNTVLVSNILIEEYNCKLGNQKQVLKDNILVLPQEILCNPSIKSITIHAATGSWKDDEKLHWWRKLESKCRDNCTDMSHIVIYKIMEFFILKPKDLVKRIVRYN